MKRDQPPRESAPGERGWERFINNERGELEARKEGQLARLLMVVLPDESREELEQMIEAERLLAQESLVELRHGNEPYYKHIDELTTEDAPARLEAESARLSWLTDRMRKVFEDTRQRYSQST